MRKIFKLYFWFLIIFYIVVLVLSIGDQEPLTFEDSFDLIVSLVTLLGVFGYAYSKNIFSTLFWKSYLPFVVIWDGYYLTDFITNDPELFSEEFGIWFFVFISFVFLILIVPSYIAIYFYCREKNT